MAFAQVTGNPLSRSRPSSHCSPTDIAHRLDLETSA